MRWIWLVAAGCERPQPPDPAPDTPATTESAAETGDSGLVPPDGPISGASYRLHEIGSLAYVSWTQALPATLRVEYSFDEGVWLSAPERAYPAGPNEQLLVGIPYETVAQWRIVAEEGVIFRGEPLVTGAYPSELPRAVLTVSEPERQLAEGRWLLTSLNSSDGGWVSGDYWTVLLDRQGRLVWAQRTPGQAWTLFAQLAATGDHILWDEQTKWRSWDDGLASKVHASWLDREIEVLDTPGLHHAFVQLPDGTLAWGSKAHGGGEALVQRVPGQAGETVLWTCDEDWPVGGYWCESNGLFYVPTTDSFLFSFFTNSAILELDRSTGSTSWWAGGTTAGYGFSPPNATFSWQHGLSYTEAGTLLLSSEYGYPEETWLLEYELDHRDQVLKLVWSNSAGVRAATGGQAWRLANGNTLHIVGSAGVLREVDADGEDVWRLDFQDDHLLGHGQFVSDLYALVAPATEE
jgi:hypothetical protein